MIKPRLETIFVPDANWYLWRAFTTLRSHRPPEEALPYHFLSMVMKDSLAVKANYLLVPFDGPEVFRYKVYPEYKANRNDKKGEAPVDPDSGEPKADIYSYLPNVYELLHKLGIIYFQPKIYEADDVLCSVAYKYGGRFKVVGGTQDKDAYQWLTKHCRMYDASAKAPDGKSRPRYIDMAYAEKKKGVPVAQMVDYQTLIGDKIDNIPPIKGMGPVAAKKILDQYGSILNWHKKSKADKAFIASEADNIRRNRKLVKLCTDVLPPNDLSEWKLRKLHKPDKFLSKSFHEYLLFLYPRSKGLF